ncbi:MAG: ABC transporter ATP-binding protein [Lachnospiraceae bacterium]|nr:ABC transporter ATP-binding protein [Lachnospiraceae bacterium]
MLEFQNVTISRDNRKILDNLNIEIEEGLILGLLGADDAAKTMLLEAASGGQQPDSGQILLENESIYQEKTEAYLCFGYMPKEYGFYELLRVEEYFELFLSLYKINGRYRQKRMEEIFSLFQLEKYRNCFISEIPTEIRPFLCLAKTILHDPKWLLLDEPFADLNITYRSEMIRILLILQEQGKSIILNSPMFPDLIDFITNVAILENGKVATEGKTDAIYENALKKSPVRMHVLAGMEEALMVLKKNTLVDRVTVDGMDVIFHFNGGEKEEAELLNDLVLSGALIQNYLRDRVNIEKIFRR